MSDTTRAQVLESVKDVLGKIAIECIDTDDLDVAVSLVNAAQLVKQAADQLGEIEAGDVASNAAAAFLG